MNSGFFLSFLSFFFFFLPEGWRAPIVAAVTITVSSACESGDERYLGFEHTPSVNVAYSLGCYPRRENLSIRELSLKTCRDRICRVSTVCFFYVISWCLWGMLLLWHTTKSSGYRWFCCFRTFLWMNYSVWKQICLSSRGSIAWHLWPWALCNGEDGISSLWFLNNTSAQVVS